MLIRPILFVAATLSIIVFNGCRSSGDGKVNISTVHNTKSDNHALDSGTVDQTMPVVVEPIDVRKEGYSTIRTYVLHPGDGMRARTGGVWVMQEVSEDKIVFGPFPEFSVSAKPGGEYSLGNRQYLKVLSAQNSPPEVVVELKTRKRPWWDTSF